MTKNTEAGIRGAVYGLAFGDAWGYPQEFADYNQVRQFRPDFPKPALISDDTQMSLYITGAAVQDLGFAHSNIKQLEAASTEFNVNEVRIQFANALKVWLFDPDNTRAPGITCINALMALEDRYLITGLEGTVEQSKGNGANIRAPWLGLLPLPERTIENIAVLQASVTHNHPLALAAAAVTALLTRRLLTGEIVPGNHALYTAARDLTESLLQGMPDANLGTNYTEGLTMLLAYLDGTTQAVTAFDGADELSDICKFTGAAGVAEEAMLAAILVTDRYHTLPMAGLRRLAHASGDTDSMAAIAGAFLGAAVGDGAWPVEWYGDLEPRYQTELHDMVEQLDALQIKV